ncbi:DUF4011 domain-containing protein [Planosporangium sp. 12N6]|uniref:DUF4011 domain-containing protein n=1 Tax=Planosporangium spinosum TaxID=3402278 RepID=UPI003CF9E7A2
MRSGVFERFTEDNGDLRAELLIQPAINYALVHNRVPVVRHVSVTNDTGAPVADLRITLELLGPDGPLTAPWSRTAPGPVAPGAVVEWTDFADFVPDQSRLRANDEAFPVDYRLTIARPGQPDTRLVAPSSALAHNEWFNSPTLYDTLAAFVQPNAPAVEATLRAAARILLERTGSGSLQGYQGGPQRAARIAGAVYEALRQLDIHYQSPPASFEHTGQKVRSTAAVLDGRMGNCLDLSVTYAACLEAAGLRPLIWLTTDHAFAGLLMADERLGDTAVTDTAALVSLVESGRAVPVELTGIGPGAASADFTAAVEAGLAHFRARQQDLQGVVDVHLAHQCGIRPLPSAEPAAPTSTTVRPERVGSIELPPGVARTALNSRGDAGDDTPERVDDAPRAIRQWRRALLDLNLRNPLLNLPGNGNGSSNGSGTGNGNGLDLHVPSRVLALLHDLVHEGAQLHVVAQDAVGPDGRHDPDLDPDLLARQLRTDRRVYGAVSGQAYLSTMRGLQRAARTMEQETGGNCLYLTIGTLAHSLGNGAPAYAPLFLVPVRLEGGAGRRPYTVVADGSQPPTVNHCLVEWLRVKYGLELPELDELADPAGADFGFDIATALTAISGRLVENRVNCRVDEGASLRLLRLSPVQMWRDLADHWPAFTDNPVVRHLVAATGSPFDDPAAAGADPHVDEAAAGTDPRVGEATAGTDPHVDEADLPLPLPADGSQLRAVALAEQGRSFILEGPPGTGKSQTITNLIARAVASGRSVLFVAEKGAALDVVTRRLGQVGLGASTLDLYGRGRSADALRQRLRQALDQRVRDEDADWNAVETGYRARLGPLAGYPTLVHTPNAAGLSTWSAYERALAYGDGPSAPVPVDHLTVTDDQRRRVVAALRALPAAARAARLRPAHPWSLSGRRTLDGLHADAVTHLAADLEEVRAHVAQRPPVVRLLRRLSGPAAISGLLPVARLAAAGSLPDHRAVTAAEDAGWDAAVTELQTQLTRFRQAYAAEITAYRPEVFTLAELPAWHAEAQAAGRRFFGKGKRLRAVAGRLAPYLRPTAVIDAYHVEQLLARLVAAGHIVTALNQRLAELGGLPVPDGWSPAGTAASTELAQAKQATEASRHLIARQPAAWPLLQAGMTDDDVRLLERLAAGWRAWRGILQSTHPQLRLWADGMHWFDAWRRDGATWLADLRAEKLLAVQRWADLLNHTDVLAAAGLVDYADQLLRGEVDPDLAEQAYQRAVAATSVSERLQAGGLDRFDADVHDNHVAQYEAAAARLRTALVDHLPSALVRARPFDTGDRRVAEFTAELRRGRGGRTFRELFAAYPDLVLALTPCVVASPGSVAALLAPDAARFDLVVFDEASQIPTAEAIGAMGRGRAVVVVGDPHQLPPHPLLPGGGETGREAGGRAAEVPSILGAAVDAGLPRHRLSWHYRSRDESLIAFSNRHFYDGALASLPAPGTTGATGIGWRRVDGYFDRGASRTNEVEARAVVAEIAARLRDPATAAHSIGVVTFTTAQRDLILNLLEDSTDRLVRRAMSPAATEPVFVKEVTDVQGDERDLILLSLGFATNPDTGQLLLDFGPLGQPGGERRLNVAITRARRQVLVFASFDPGDIRLSRTSAPGVAHLRAYCELAAAAPADRAAEATPGRRAGRDRIRDEVAEALRARGHEVVCGYGQSDFTVDVAVRVPGARQWQVAVLLDGPQWSTRPTVADREGAPALLRTRMGWPEVVRCWLPSWIRDRSVLLDNVDAALARAVEAEEAAATDAVTAAAEAVLAGADAATDADDAVAATDAGGGTGPAGTPAGPPKGTDPVVTRPLTAAGTTGGRPAPVRLTPAQRSAPERVLVAGLSAPPAPPVETAPDALPVPGDADDAAPARVAADLIPFVPYQPTVIGSQTDIDLLHSDSRVRKLMQSTLREIVAAEGPVEQHRLAKLALARFGFVRPREDRRNAVLDLLDPGVLRVHEGVGAFAWPSTLDPKRWNGFRTTQAKTDRAFEEIAPEEVANAVRHALAVTPDLTEQELFRAALELLGYQRLTQKITKLLRYGLLVALTSGRVVHAGRGRYRLS